MGPIEKELRRCPVTSQLDAWNWLTRFPEDGGSDWDAFNFVNGLAAKEWAPTVLQAADCVSEAIECASTFGL